MEPLLEPIQKYLCTNVYCGWLLIAAASFILAFGIKFAFGKVSKKLHVLALKTPTIWDTVFLELLDNVKIVVLFFWIFVVSSKPLNPPLHVVKILSVLMVILTAYQVSLWGLHILKNWYNQVSKEKISRDPAASGALGLMYKFMQAALIILVVLIALSNLNINVGALLAGLGVGGIAVALAAQNVLGDLLASLSIILDKPFCVGDYIITGNEKGTVERIGIKTTRLRSLSGEEIVISNKSLLDSRIQNFKRMSKRRVMQKIGVVYSTPTDVLARIPGWLKEIIDKESTLDFDRCHLANFGSSALEFELSCYVLDTDYKVFMSHQQQIMLEIVKKFRQENIQFAFPTQTIFLEK